MPLPDSFSEAQHLKAVLKKVHNQNVREEFSDLGDGDWEPDISIPRGSLRQACTIKDNDSQIMILNRLFLYYFDLRKAQDLQTPVYGTILPEFQATRRFKPQITLHFREDLTDVDPDYDPVRGEISFRLMDEESTTITKTKLRTIAQRIKTKFGTGNGYVWKKGKELYTYYDYEKGYKLQILSRNKTEAKELIDNLLDIRTFTPNWENLKLHKTEEELEVYPYTPPSKSIMGKTRKEPRRRPNVDVRFRYAEAYVWGVNKSIRLYDHSYTFLDALVE